jgi:hypothetical protein
MATYVFEALMTLSELIEVEADSYDEAYDLALDGADEFNVITPSGYAIPWDYIEINDHELPEEN